MGDEHLSTTSKMESDGIIKSSVENLILIPSEDEGIFDDTCDVPICEDSSTLKDHFEILSDSNDDDTLSDDDAFEDIEYVEASLPNSKLVSLKEVNDVDQEKKEIDLEEILQIQDVILHEKLLNINCLIANIESLNDNPTPDHVLKSPSLFPIPVKDSDSLMKETDISFSYSHNSLPKFETFSDHTKEMRSDSTIAHANNSLPEFDLFRFEIDLDQGRLTSVVNDSIPLPKNESSNFDHHDDPSFPRPPSKPPNVEVFFDFEPDSGELISAVINNIDDLNEDECFDPGGGEIDIFANVEDDDYFPFIFFI
nr:hypothetical protein [Tanacetum cinerariifolium]